MQRQRNRRNLGIALAVAAALLVVLAGVAMAESEPALPEYHARVNDFTGSLRAEDVQAIEGYLADLEARTGAQGAVAVVQTTEPLDPFMYGVKLFEKWKPGQAGKDNGLLVLVALKERRVEVQTGYGLEGVLNDAKIGRILDREVTPRFREGDLGGGLLAGVKAMGAEIEKEAAGGSGAGSAPQRSPQTAGSPWLVLLIPLGLGGLVLLLILYALGLFRPRCPTCGSRMLVTDRVLRRATLEEEGLGVRTTRCPKCGRTDEKTYQIPRRRPDPPPDPTIRRGGGPGGIGGMGGMGGFGRRGGSGGSGWGGFGGGRSGGGGAGRGW